MEWVARFIHLFGGDKAKGRTLYRANSQWRLATIDIAGYAQGPLRGDFKGRLASCLHATAAAEAPQQQATGVPWLGKGTPGHPRTAHHFARLVP